MAEIEQPMPPWGPRYEPIDPICDGMGTTDVIDFSCHRVLDWPAMLDVLSDDEVADLRRWSLA